MQSIPGGKQFSVMDLDPCFHESALPVGEAATDELRRIDGKDTDVILIVRVKMWPMVRRRGLGKHADDDPEESGDLWHGLPRIVRLYAPGFLSVNVS